MLERPKADAAPASTELLSPTAAAELELDPKEFERPMADEETAPEVEELDVPKRFTFEQLFPALAFPKRAELEPALVLPFPNELASDALAAIVLLRPKAMPTVAPDPVEFENPTA